MSVPTAEDAGSDSEVVVLQIMLITLGVGGLAWVWHVRPQQRARVLAMVAAGGLGFQAVHVLEHGVQAAAWLAAPTRAPYLTPWALAGRDALAVGGNVPLGGELLHLLGNLVFLAGLLAFAALGPRPRTGGGHALKVALAVQVVHVAEHLILTGTVAAVGRPIGVTTLFGSVEAGPVLWSVRIVAHLGLNTLATLTAGLAVLHGIKHTEAPLRPQSDVSSSMR